MKPITPCLWFDSDAEEAVKFYTSIFRNSRINRISRYGKSAAAASGQPEGSILTITFELDGQNFMALNGGPMFKFTEAISLMVMCETQEEIDSYWNALSGPGSGGQESQCGWLKDKFGVSWQIVPTALDEMIQDKDPKRSERVMQALLGMKKLDIQTLRKRYKEA